MGVVDNIDLLKVNVAAGTGTPTHVAFPGSIYINTTGTSTVTHMFINCGSTVNIPSCSWVAVVTVAT